MPEKKIRYYGGKSYIEKMEEAAGIGPTPVPAPPVVPPVPVPPVVPPTPPATEMPYKKGEYFKPGEILNIKKLQDRSTSNSPPFTDAELKRGYRKV
jgi:hypothetical protein